MPRTPTATTNAGSAPDGGGVAEAGNGYSSEEQPEDEQELQIGEQIEKAAKQVGEAAALNKIKKALRAESPEVADDIGW